MTPAETAMLLTYVSAIDNRNVTPEAATAWSETLDDRITLESGKWLVNEHYQHSRDWLMPSDLNRRFRQVRGDRLKVIGTNIPIPPGLPAAEHQAYIDAYREAVARGEPLADAKTIACRKIGHDPREARLVDPPSTLKSVWKKIKETA